MKTRPFTPDDIWAILTILNGRDASYEGWGPDPGFSVEVAYDKDGLAGVLIYRPSPGGKILVEVVEIEYIQGKPTMRGLRALKALNDWMKNQSGTDWVALTLLENTKHLEVMERLGWVKRAYYLTSPKNYGKKPRSVGSTDRPTDLSALPERIHPAE